MIKFASARRATTVEGPSVLFLPVGLMGTCVELSRYQVLIAMGIGFGIEGVEEARR